MSRIPQKVAKRLSFALKQFQPILESAKSRDHCCQDVEGLACMFHQFRNRGVLGGEV